MSHLEPEQARRRALMREAARTYRERPSRRNRWGIFPDDEADKKLDSPTRNQAKDMNREIR